MLGYGRAYGLRWAALRYFNAAGADPDGELGEAHDPEPHLVPRLIEAAKGKLGPVDGTAVRDHVRVSDLADAHVSALRYLLSQGESCALNLGTGRGASVRQVVTAVERVSGAAINVKPAPRRLGDPPH